MKNFKNLINEIQQPLSQGEKNFKDMHGDLPAAIEKAKKLVPGITDQDVLFNGRPRRMDQPTASVEDKKTSVDNYDKGLKVGPNPEKDMNEALEKETIKHPVGQRPKGIGWVLKQAGEQTGKDHSVWERKVQRVGKVDEEADLTKIDTKTLQALTQLHKHYGQKDPRAKASAERGEAELKKRMNKEEVEPVDEAGLPPHLAKMFNAKGDLKDPEKQKIYNAHVNKVLGAAKDHKAEYSKMRKDMGMDDKETTRKLVGEKTLTPAELKKREEIAQAMERENPDMPMAKKMAIATATAKRVAEEAEMDYEGEMARSELNAICDKSRKLADMMADDMQLEAWLQSKITKAKYMIDSVYDYLMYSDKKKSPMPAADVSSYAQAPAIAANYSSFLNKIAEEKILSAKQNAIAELNPPEDELDAGDFKKLRSTKKETDTEDTTAHRRKIISKTVQEAAADDEEKEDKQSGASLNPITRLNAAHQLLRGKIGIKHPIKFDDGKHELDINTVRKALDLHSNAKTAAEKEKIQNAFKTHAGLQKALRGEFPSIAPKVTLGGSANVGGRNSIKEYADPFTGKVEREMVLSKDRNGRPYWRRSSPGEIAIGKVGATDDTSVSEEATPKLSKANMQQDSLDRLVAMSPQASKVKIKLPPTQGNETIGGEEEVYPNIATEETMLNSLYQSLSEDNKEKFMEKLETEDGLADLLQFAQEQGF